MKSKHGKKRKKQHDHPQGQVPEPQQVVEFEHNNKIIEKKHKKIIKRKTLDVNIQTINERVDKMSPLVGYFSNGFDPCKSSEPPEVNLYRNLEQKSRMQVVVNLKGSDVNFVRTNYSGEAAAEEQQLCTYALGVLDKHTCTLKILPITANEAEKYDSLRQKHDPIADHDMDKVLEEVKVNAKALDTGTTNTRNIHVTG